MTATKEKVRAATPEQRQKAVDMVAVGATLREAAAAAGVSYQTVSNWVRAEKSARLPKFLRPAPPVAPGQRKPIHVNGQRLGRLALWK